MKKAILLTSLLCLSSSSFSANSNSCSNFKDNKCYYDADKAVTYAINQLDSKEWNDYFPEYTDFSGNCTNFANQAILAGLVGSTSPKELYSNAKFFATDKHSNSSNKWYFINKSGGVVNASRSWKGAKELKADANANEKYKGMHFKFITKDSSTKSLKFSKINKGDIIFSDWTRYGTIDHTMIVTNKTGNSYKGVFVTYQNATGYEKRKNITLSSINKKNTVFYIL